MKQLSLVLFLIISYLLLATNSYAQYGQYGGVPATGKLIIEKTVAKPVTTKGGITEFVNNLSPFDPRFAPSQDVQFKLRVKNVSSIKLTNVQVKDFAPQELETIEGAGTYDRNTRIITINAGDFNPDEEKTFFIKMKVLAQDKLPANKGLFCIVNKAQVSTDQVADESTSQICIEKEVGAVVATPKAGPEMNIALLIGEFLTLGAGLYLKKKIS